MYNLLSLKITQAKSPKPPEMYQRDAVDTSPDLGGKMSPQNLRNDYLTQWADDTDGIVESFVTVAGLIFT